MEKQYLSKNLICKFCLCIFDSKTRNSKQRFCSKVCAGKGNKNNGRFKKGQEAWNKGLIGYRKGYKMSDETKKKIGKANFKEKNAHWKGEDASYSSKHKWMLRHRGKAKKCEFCGKEGEWIDWANKSGEYKREDDDWMQLCRSCHKKYDQEK
ncbi:MAG TPA: hypothetical protein DHN29_05550 [Cytophagales bacterium]|jgi:hypothetical protein|nr:hypothetical protein [Cytophagales bacterium]|tara:strand:- start:161 stop:616 length:456 start_codon:yes stop_codon:yes gene_type:complete